MRGRASGRQAVTVLELAVASACVAVLLVSVLVVLNQLMACSAKTADTAAGLIFADRLIDTMVALKDTKPYVDAGYFADTLTTGAPVTYPGNETIQTHATNITQNFMYNLTITPLTDKRGADSNYGRSFLLHVDVWWWVNNPGQYREGLGKLSVSLERMMYHRDPSVAPGQ